MTTEPTTTEELLASIPPELLEALPPDVREALADAPPEAIHEAIQAAALAGIGAQAGPVPVEGLALDLHRMADAGMVLQLQGDQLHQLGDLAAFGMFARDRLWPLVAYLQPIAEQAAIVGPQLAALPPAQQAKAIVGLFKG